MAEHDHHGMNEPPGLARFCSPDHEGEHEAARPGRFGRMFGGTLPPNYTRPDLLTLIGQKGGPMDGGPGSDRTDTVPVGQVFFGQFVDHDITLDVVSSLSRNQRAADTPNARTPTLDLDCIYGDGPEAQPYLYDADGVKLLTGADVPGAGVTQQNDLLRSVNGRAMIGDPRNDENRVVSQLQLGMIRFHNAMADKLAKKPNGPSADELFEVTRREVTWHYQWCVVFDFLSAMCGRPVVEDILANGRTLYCHVSEPYIPVEFAVAAYRFGHSMVPMQLQVQLRGSSYELFGNALGQGFSQVGQKEAIVDWHELFDTDADRIVQRAEKLDTKMASDLLALPFVTSGERSLATRNLLRGNVFRLPAGEAVAELVAAATEVDAQVDTVMDRVRSLSEDAVAGTSIPPIDTGAPLWLYLLAEAEIIGRAEPGGGHNPGEGLGPVGARIVAETLIGLLELDEHSFLGANRNWMPTPDYASIGAILASTNWPGLPT
ncbi:MAG: heme peroxidase family protein [Actinomycetota bacterium]|nr:heme peroxidase family protein [Actinomycetota bacterium]